MSSSITIRLLIKGHFRSNTFPDWIVRRATKLSLTGWVQSHNDSLIEIVVRGDKVLVEALEVACSLGPITAQVDSIDKQPASSVKLRGRQVGHFIRY